MAWVRLDDEFPEHPKLISVGPLGMALQVAALCYSNAHLTDGFIQFNVVNKLLSWEFSPPGSDVVYTVGLTSGMSGDDVDSKTVAEWLVSAGIWEQVPGGYFIHDYTDYQMTKEEIYALHETRTAVGKLGGRPRKNQTNQSETNLVSKSKANGNQTHNQNESKTKPQSQSQSQSQSPIIPNIDNESNKVVVSEDEEQRQPPNIYRIYESEIGALTPMLSEELDDIEKAYPDGWFYDAVKEAKRSSSRVTLKYIQAILKRWKAEGHQSDNKPQNDPHYGKKKYTDVDGNEEWL